MEAELGTNGAALGVKMFEADDSIVCKFVFAFKFYYTFINGLGF